MMAIHCLRLNFCHIAVTLMATIVATKQDNTQGINTSAGLCDFMIALCAIMLTGMICKPDACSTINMICELEAVSFTGLISCKLFMAFNAKGVAALSSPNKL